MKLKELIYMYFKGPKLRPSHFLRNGILKENVHLRFWLMWQIELMMQWDVWAHGHAAWSPWCLKITSKLLELWEKERERLTRRRSVGVARAVNPRGPELRTLRRVPSDQLLVRSWRGGRHRAAGGWQWRARGAWTLDRKLGVFTPRMSVIRRGFAIGSFLRKWRGPCRCDGWQRRGLFLCCFRCW